jgi:hypothetical protein
MTGSHSPSSGYLAFCPIRQGLKCVRTVVVAHNRGPADGNPLAEVQLAGDGLIGKPDREELQDLPVEILVVSCGGTSTARTRTSTQKPIDD